MSSRVESKYTQPPSINTNNQPTDRKCKESCEQTNDDCYIYIIACIVVICIIVGMFLFHMVFGCRSSAKPNTEGNSTTTPDLNNANDIQSDVLSSNNPYTRDTETSRQGIKNNNESSTNAYIRI
jgi:hypothetical protein